MPHSRRRAHEAQLRLFEDVPRRRPKGRPVPSLHYICPTCQAPARRKSTLGPVPKGCPACRLCLHCGDALRRDTERYCSRQCGYDARKQRAAKAVKPARQPYVQQVSPLGSALANGDTMAVVRILRARTTPTEAGCWQWVGTPGKDGYPNVNVGRRRRRSAHRVMAHAVHGELGHQPVHHKCGNRLCINPAHLQVVTPIENTAEMLERQHYLRRIAALEEALRCFAPQHALLPAQEAG